MNIAKGSSFFSSIMAMQNSFAASSKIKKPSQDLMQAGRDLHNEIGNNRSGYEMAQENTDLDLIWQRARDWGLTEQQKIVNRARELGVRASSDLIPDNARKIIQNELESLQAENTRIGLTNNINGSHTLARFEPEQVVDYVDEVTEGETEEVEVKQPQIDVLWVIDRTGSMDRYSDRLVLDAEQMFEKLEDKGFDVRMAFESFERGLDDIGSPDFRNDANDFINDVGKIDIHGYMENGITGAEKGIERYGEKMRPNATKVTVLLTNDFADDFAPEDGFGADQAAALTDTPEGEKLRQRVADKFKANDSEFYLVGGSLSTFWKMVPGHEDAGEIDRDYIDIVDKVGKGAYMKLDDNGIWINTITDRFIASVETDIEKGKFDGVATRRVVTDDYELKDEWDMNFHVGPDAGDHIVERFKTSTSLTSGFENADFSTAAKARDSLDIIDDTNKFYSDNHTQVGVLQNNFRSISNELFNRAVYDRRPFSLFTTAMSSYIGASGWGVRG